MVRRASLLDKVMQRRAGCCYAGECPGYAAESVCCNDDLEARGYCGYYKDEGRRKKGLGSPRLPAEV